MLTNEQARENLKKYGPNELEEGKKKSVFQIFLNAKHDLSITLSTLRFLPDAREPAARSARSKCRDFLADSLLGKHPAFPADNCLARDAASTRPRRGTHSPASLRTDRCSCRSFRDIPRNHRQNNRSDS